VGAIGKLGDSMGIPGNQVEGANKLVGAIGIRAGMI